jgi:hypothetical protein
MIRPPRRCPKSQPKSSSKSKAENVEIQGPILSCAGGPRDILGRGRHRWAGSPHLHREVWAEILRVEIGGVVFRRK